MPDELLLQATRGATATLTLNRPKALNAFSSGLLQALRAALGECARNGALRCVVLTGAGRAFSAGADIAEMRALSPLQSREFSRLGHAACEALEALPVPVIAAVNGAAFGGGCEIALACDFIWAAEGARFGQPEVKLGLVPGFGGTQRLQRRVGGGWARELVLGGAPLSAAEAQRIGLVNRTFADAAALLSAAHAFGESLAQCGPAAVALAKSAIHEGQNADLRSANALEQNAFAAAFASADAREGMAAFLEKRAAKFTGQ